MRLYGAYDDIQPEGERAWRTGRGGGREPLFIGAVALSSNPGAMRGVAGRAVKALHAAWPDRASLSRLQHLHFRDQKPDEQVHVLRSMADFAGAQVRPEACMLVVAVLPISAFAPGAKKEAIYIEGTGWLLRQVAALLPQGAEVELALDDPVGGNRTKKQNLRAALLNLAQPAWQKGLLTIEFAHKEQERLIQWADYVAGAALQRHLRGNSAPWKIIHRNVVELPRMPLAPGTLQRRRS